MKDPIYTPKGKAFEYAELALNIYNGCPHDCDYCFGRGIARKDRQAWRDFKYRDGLMEALKKQLDKGEWGGKLVHLCL